MTLAVLLFFAFSGGAVVCGLVLWWAIGQAAADVIGRKLW